MWRWLSFRSRILVIVVAGVVAPLAMTGLWLATGAVRSGEALIRRRLDDVLNRSAGAAVAEWARQRAGLLDAAGAAASFTSRLSDPQSAFTSVSFRDASGTERLSFVSDRPPIGAILEVDVPVFTRDAAPAGILRASLAANALLDLSAAQNAGALVALFDTAGRPLSPLPMDPSLLRYSRFSWAGDEWLTSRRTLVEPPVTFVVAASTASVGPFEAAASRGIVVVILMSLSAFALAMLLTSRVTHLREQSERRAITAVSELAATIAHEVRNPLTSMRLDLQYVEERLPAESPLRAVQASALLEVDRLDASVRNALHTARDASLASEELDLREVVDHAVHAAAPEFQQQGATLEYDRFKRRLVVRGDRAALQQLVLNLLLNAAQSLSAGGRAHVDFVVEAEDVQMRCRDNGIGIGAEDLQRIFEPFFTRRPTGTGIGLGAARRVARAHGGDVEVHSELGEGTTAVVKLPRARV